jgi:uncharacterized protein YjbI with pentapeptide repeats
MTNEDSLHKLQYSIQQVVKAETNDFVELAKIAGLDIATDFTGADLSGADLRNANLRNANLKDTNLSGADLSYANLSYANLRSADLRFANLTGADLSNADLSNADLRDADLRDAKLRNADLSGTKLRRIAIPIASSDLSDTKLRRIAIPIVSSAIPIASSIVPLIANKALEKGGEKLGESAYNKINQMITAIRNKFKKVGREGILIDVEAEPSEENQSELKTTLEEQMNNDYDFAEQLREFVKQLKSEGVLPFHDLFPRNINVRMGSHIENFTSGRDIKIGDE